MIFIQRKLFKLLVKLNVYSAKRYLDSISILRGGAGGSGHITMNGQTYVTLTLVGSGAGNVALSVPNVKKSGI